MRFRLTSLVAVLALVITACGATTSDTTAAPDEDTTTSLAVDAPDATLLSYSLASGDTFVYEVEINQNIVLTSDGEGAGFTGETDEMPGEANVDLVTTGTYEFVVADGPEPGTYEVTITGELGDVSATGTVDGEPLAEEDIPSFAEMEPVSMTVIVDEQGNVIPDDPSGEDPFEGLFGGMGDLGTGAVPGAQLGQFFGPPFSEDEVTVGDTWSTSFDTPGLTEEPITTSVTSTVTGTDEIGGNDVLVIETSTLVGAFDFDFGDFLIGMFAGFMPDDLSEEEQAEMDALMEEFRFLMSFDETQSDSTTYFDPAAGLTRQFDVSSTSGIGMDVNFPDEETGELAAFAMKVSISQSVSHRLLEGPAA